MAMIGAGNAMGMFEAGMTGGQVKGAYGIGGAIRGMLDQARKVGLVQQQTEGNVLSSIGSTMAKQKLETDYGNQDIETPYYGANGELIKMLPHKRAIDPIVQKPVTAEEQLYQLELEDTLKYRAEEAASGETTSGGDLRTGKPISIFNFGKKATPASVPTFKTEAELDAALASGVVKPGTKVIVGGVSGTAQ